MPVPAQTSRSRPVDRPGVPPRKPLYLVANTPATVDASAESLLLRRAGLPIQRFPFVRIARVICNGHATWTGAALQHCLAEGIPIVWLDGHGRALGSGQPRQTLTTPTATQIETYLELPGWPQRFANWRARRRLETLTVCARRATEAGRPPSPEDFAERKRQFVYGGEIETTFDPAGQAWCHACVADRLQREKLQVRYWGFDGEPFELCAELTELLWAELNFDSGSLPARTEPGKLAAHLFEAWVRQREHRLLHHLSDFKRHLAREIASWH